MGRAGSGDASTSGNRDGAGRDHDDVAVNGGQARVAGRALGASGAGRITHYEGLDHLLGEYRDHVAALELLPPGAPRRDWRATLIADGMVIVRHPDLPKAMEMAQRFAAELHLFAA